MRTEILVALLPASITLAAGLPALRAQGAIGLVGSGYAAPAPPAVAPGQLVSLFFRGVSLQPDGGLRLAKAESLPHIDADALSSSAASPVRFGEVGLYQLNIEVPGPFSRRCRVAARSGQTQYF